MEQQIAQMEPGLYIIRVRASNSVVEGLCFAHRPMQPGPLRTKDELVVMREAEAMLATLV